MKQAMGIQLIIFAHVASNLVTAFDNYRYEIDKSWLITRDLWFDKKLIALRRVVGITDLAINWTNED